MGDGPKEAHDGPAEAAPAAAPKAPQSAPQGGRIPSVILSQTYEYQAHAHVDSAEAALANTRFNDRVAKVLQQLGADQDLDDDLQALAQSQETAGRTNRSAAKGHLNTAVQTALTAIQFGPKNAGAYAAKRRAHQGLADLLPRSNTSGRIGQLSAGLKEARIEEALLQPMIQDGRKLSPQHQRRFAESIFQLGRLAAQLSHLVTDEDEKAALGTESYNAYQRAAKVNPNHPTAWKNIGSQNFTDAKKDAEAGDMEGAAGNAKDALDCFDRAIAAAAGGTYPKAESERAALVAFIEENGLRAHAEFDI